MTTFEGLLQGGNLICAHHTNIQSLAIKSYKVNNNLSGQIMSEIFRIWHVDHNFTALADFVSIHANKQVHGLTSLAFCQNLHMIKILKNS